MQQYQAIKARYPHALLLFRLGDFYELFYEDAMLASRELQITLTSRNREKGQPIPMCGVPYHAADGYVARLIRAGFKIAICDQMEQPGPGKKIVRREVVRVITPGTATDVAVLDARENNFLAAVATHPSGSPVGLAFVDLSTGEFQATEFSGPRAAEDLARRTCNSFIRAKLFFPARSNCSTPPRILCPKALVVSNPASTTGFFSTTTHRASCASNSGWPNSPALASTIITNRWPPQARSSTTYAKTPHAASTAPAITSAQVRSAVAGADSHATVTGSDASNANANAPAIDEAASLDALRHLDRIRYYEQHDSLGS